MVSRGTRAGFSLSVVLLPQWSGDQRWRLHPGVRAPQRNREAGEERKAKRARRLRGDAPDLLANDIERSGGQDARELGEMLAHRTRVGEETIERDEGGNAGEERQKCIERDAGGNREHPILADLLVNTPEDVLPPVDRHLAWGLGGAAAIALSLGRALGVAALERQLVLLCAGFGALAPFRHPAALVGNGIGVVPGPHAPTAGSDPYEREPHQERPAALLA